MGSRPISTGNAICPWAIHKPKDRYLQIRQNTDGTAQTAASHHAGSWQEDRLVMTYIFPNRIQAGHTKTIRFISRPGEDFFVQSQEITACFSSFINENGKVQAALYPIIISFPTMTDFGEPCLLAGREGFGVQQSVRFSANCIVPGADPQVQTLLYGVQIHNAILSSGMTDLADEQNGRDFIISPDVESGRRHYRKSRPFPSPRPLTEIERECISTARRETPQVFHLLPRPCDEDQILMSEIINAALKGRPFDRRRWQKITHWRENALHIRKIDVESKIIRPSGRRIEW